MKVAAADFVLRDTGVDGGLMHKPLDDIGGLGPAGAAIGVDGRRVGEHGGHFAVDRRRRVLPREQRRVQDRRDARRERRQIRAHVRRRVHAHRQELAVLVERKLGVRDVVAAVRVGQERFAAIGGPLDRTVDLFRRPDHRGLFGVEIDLGAEAAADVGRDHAHLVLGQAQHERGHQQPLDVRVLVGDVQRIAVIVPVVRR